MAAKNKPRSSQNPLTHSLSTHKDSPGGNDRQETKAVASARQASTPQKALCLSPQSNGNRHWPLAHQGPKTVFGDTQDGQKPKVVRVGHECFDRRSRIVFWIQRARFVLADGDDRRAR